MRGFTCSNLSHIINMNMNVDIAVAIRLINDCCDYYQNYGRC